MAFKILPKVISAVCFGLIGLLAVFFLPLPPFLALAQAKVLYPATGLVIGFLFYPQISFWISKSFSKLIKILIFRLVAEMINQFTQLTSRGMMLIPNQFMKRNPKQRFLSPVIVDTSALIDGRILDISKYGFLWGLILVPHFVLTELQKVADSKDEIKRGKGRRGLGMVEELRKVSGVKVEIWEKEVAGKGVDEKLIRLGKILQGKLLTCDFNLGKVAALSGLKVLNINELSEAVRINVVPGEKLEVKVVRQGSGHYQGVGFLEDGTMVVVENGVGLVGKRIIVTAVKILQGPSGRMVFGKI